MIQPPARPKIMMSRIARLGLGFLSISRTTNGGILDCQRAVAEQGLDVEAGVILSLTYSARLERYPGLREVKLGLQFWTPIAGPYIATTLTQTSIRENKENGWSTVSDETSIRYGLRLPLRGPFFEVEHIREKHKPSPTAIRRRIVRYGTWIPRGSVDVEVEMTRTGDGKVDWTKTITTAYDGISTGKSVTRTMADPPTAAPVVADPMMELGEGSVGGPHHLAAESSTSAAAHTSPVAAPAPAFADDAPGQITQNDGAATWRVAFYVVVGILNRKTGAARESIAGTLTSQDKLFKAVRTASWGVWPLYKRLFSLKEVAGFGLYHCDVETGQHRSVTLDGRTRESLLELYTDYKADNGNMDDAWGEWTHQHLNGGSADPAKGDYTLELLLRWSAVKIVIYGLLPVVGSLVVGVAYMRVRVSEADDLGSDLAVIQTAWAISSYVVGAAGVNFALLAVITQLTDA
ncbi:hypothetical protein B0H63DRAFT_140998 [Podospora didyma]|uniref:Uncharacterized protein n=1 Tax=Podospora didyma TaxID=330526 RepID=A0AAE0U177_9PEZI|nr:hypothetical protein B0H63DRAFT_140998 [Podospora didyma]